MWCVCELAPDGVTAPTAVVIGTTYMELEWRLPTSLNGVLTGFTLVQSPSMTLYSGALTSHNVTNLTVHTQQLNSTQLSLASVGLSLGFTWSWSGNYRHH